MLVAIIIVTIAVSTAIPSFLRQMRQGEVDRYAQQLEAGFFGLRAKLGRQKTSCTLKFENAGLENFVAPSELVEMTNNPERLECCNTEIRTAGRNTQGVRIIKLSGDEKVVSAIKIDDNLI